MNGISNEFSCLIGNNDHLIICVKEQSDLMNIWFVSIDELTEKARNTRVNSSAIEEDIEEWMS